MGTSAEIGIVHRRSDHDIVRVLTVGHDGNIPGVGRELLEHYNDNDKITELVNKFKYVSNLAPKIKDYQDTVLQHGVEERPAEETQFVPVSNFGSRDYCRLTNADYLYFYRPMFGGVWMFKETRGKRDQWIRLRHYWVELFRMKAQLNYSVNLRNANRLDVALAALRQCLSMMCGNPRILVSSREIGDCLQRLRKTPPDTALKGDLIVAEYALKHVFDTLEQKYIELED